MSEEILKALAQLYAIITKQDTGVSEKERNYVIDSFRSKLDQVRLKEYVALYDEFAGTDNQEKKDKPEKLTSVKDSVRTLSICRKINKTLVQKQKIIVLIELLELVRSDGNYTPQRKQIIETVSESFNIEKNEHDFIEWFVFSKPEDLKTESAFLFIKSEGEAWEPAPNIIFNHHILAPVRFLFLESVDLIFLKTEGEGFTLNGLPVNSEEIKLFPYGSILKSSIGATFFYSDIIRYFIKEENKKPVTFNVTDLEYTFQSGRIGLRDINISEREGTLIGIMGASGAGKTTLLNVLSGIEIPSKGQVVLNGIDIHKEKEKATGIIGYISQDDLLFEDLTVFENLFYCAKLCFDKLPDAEIREKVESLLGSLGLAYVKDLKVGSPLEKTISGGQRKRLNIALELIREPLVLFVDEPTSGLSSRDSENVIDLLKELSLKGKLIFVVIHQPSSDIYKMFDKMYILDTGGFPIFYGNPVEGVIYFKKIANHADAEKGQCFSCGNVNPEQIFNIVEEQVVDEYGNFTGKRKISTSEWYTSFKKNFDILKQKDSTFSLPKGLDLPTITKQSIIFFLRDLKGKLSNKQYLLINLIEAPLLALILSVVIRYKNTTNEYLFRFNENIPAFILMSVIVALFMGLSLSAEEIIRDRKILKREKLLNLSRLGYLLSKIVILFSFSAIQTFLFVVIGTLVLDIKGMGMSYWLILFSSSCAANVLGLIISSAFNSAVIVYILIPLILIPQMILSGALFSFDKLNDFLTNDKNKVPFVADLMISRWGYEALAVSQFKDNEYQSLFFKEEQIKAVSDFQLAHGLPLVEELVKKLQEKGISEEERKIKWNIVLNEIKKNERLSGFPSLDQISTLENAGSTEASLEAVLKMLPTLDSFYNKTVNHAVEIMEKKGLSNSSELKNSHYNESLSDLVRNQNSVERYKISKQEILPKVDLVFFASKPDGNFGYRAHFYAPSKYLGTIKLDTFWFNLIVLWTITGLFFAFLYFDILRIIIDKSSTMLQKKN